MEKHYGNSCRIAVLAVSQDTAVLHSDRPELEIDLCHSDAHVDLAQAILLQA
jgi:hypothetical protein